MNKAPARPALEHSEKLVLRISAGGAVLHVQDQHIRLVIYAQLLQAAFHVFGMELLAQLDIQATNNFFSTFFRLPDRYWRGFLASSLSSRQLIIFAMWMMVRAPPTIQFKLMQHMLRDPAGKYMLRTYAGMLTAHGCHLH